MTEAPFSFVIPSQFFNRICLFEIDFVFLQIDRDPAQDRCFECDDLHDFMLRLLKTRFNHPQFRCTNNRSVFDKLAVEVGPVARGLPQPTLSIGFKIAPRVVS